MRELALVLEMAEAGAEGMGWLYMGMSGLGGRLARLTKQVIGSLIV